MVVDSEGVITFVGTEDAAPASLLEGAEHLELGKGAFLVPGFIDTHIHAPQYTFTGIFPRYFLPI